MTKINFGYKLRSIMNPFPSLLRINGSWARGFLSPLLPLAA